MSQSSRLTIALCLGVLAVFGPLATDMYIAAIPDIAASLHVGEGEVQMSVMGYFIGFTLGQLFWGPFSDRFGRKHASLIAIAIFAVSSFGCAWSGDVQTLLGFRFLEGVGGAVGMVVGLSVVRDLFTGMEAAKLMGMTSLIMGIAPVLAPFGGSLILRFGNWEGIFIFLGIFAVLGFVLVMLKLPETRAPEDREPVSPIGLVKTYAGLLRRRSFFGYASAGALLQAGFFAYITGSSSVLISIFGLSPTTFSLIFAVNAIGLGIGVQINSRLITRLSPRLILRLAIALNAACGVVLVMLQMAGLADIYAVCGLLFVLVGSMGAIMPTGNMLAMEENGRHAGTAAALLGALGFGGGAVSGALLGVFADGTAMPLFAIMAACGVLGLAASLLLFPPQTQGDLVIDGLPEKA